MKKKAKERADKGRPDYPLTNRLSIIEDGDGGSHLVAVPLDHLTNPVLITDINYNKEDEWNGIVTNINYNKEWEWLEAYFRFDNNSILMSMNFGEFTTKGNDDCHAHIKLMNKEQVKKDRKSIVEYYKSDMKKYSYMKKEQLKPLSNAMSWRKQFQS